MAQKQIYFFDTQKHFDHSELVAADAVVPTNATDIKPADGLYEPLTFTGSEWTGVTREEWLDNRPDEDPVEPTDQEQVIAKLTKQLAQATAQTQQAISELTKQVAALKGDSK